MERKLKNLFKPGTGVPPPYLAGRKEEREYFRDCVEALLDRDTLSQDMIIYGPRGNGKTVLLRDLQRETLRENAGKLDIAWMTPNRLRNPVQLADQLIGDDQKLRSKVKAAGISLNFGVAQGHAELDLSKRALTINDLLREKSQKKPFILIVDEAHTLGQPIRQDLLNESQNLRGEGYPFFLVLAGTPNIRSELQKANASFWGRNKRFRLGRLSIEESQEAINIPLTSCKITLVPGVAQAVAERAHCYPYFIQIWGDCLAKRLHQTGKREITMAMVREIEPEVLAECNEMYLDRRNELTEMNLLPVAECIARKFVENPKGNISEGDIHELVEKTLRGRGVPVTDAIIMEKTEKLSQVGYIWQVDYARSIGYEPGIPSLMCYVNDRALTIDMGMDR